MDEGRHLLPCPLCGGTTGYVLVPGATHRWCAVRCADCEREITECASDKQGSFDQTLPERWFHADAEWNEAAAHANQLREQAGTIPFLQARIAELEAGIAQLKDPTSVHLAMLRGDVAMPSWRLLCHVTGEVPNGEDALLSEIVRLREAARVGGEESRFTLTRDHGVMSHSDADVSGEASQHEQCQR